MQLLSPSENRKALNLEKQADMDQGIQLVRRLDTLRSQTSQEETLLKKIKEIDIPNALKELDELAVKRNFHRLELEDIQKQRKIAQEPLDKAWAELYSFNEESQRREAILDAREASIQESYKKLDQDTQKAQRCLNLIEIKRSDVEKEVLKLKGAYKILQDNISNRENYANKLEQAAFSKIKSLELRETKVAIRERDILLKERTLKKKELELTRLSIARNATNRPK